MRWSTGKTKISQTELPIKAIKITTNFSIDYIVQGLSVIVFLDFSERSRCILWARHFVRHCLARRQARTRRMLRLQPQGTHSLEGGERQS